MMLAAVPSPRGPRSRRRLGGAGRRGRPRTSRGYETRARWAELGAELRSIDLQPGSGPCPGGSPSGRGASWSVTTSTSCLGRPGRPRAHDDAGLRVVRRAHPRGVNYSLVNRGGAPVDGWVGLGLAEPAGCTSRPAVTRAIGRGGAPARRGERGVPAARPRRVGGRRGRSPPRWHRDIPGGTPTPSATRAVAGPWRLAFVEGGPVLPGVLRVPRARRRGRRSRMLRPSASPAAVATPSASTARPAAPSTGSSTWAGSPRRAGEAQRPGPWHALQLGLFRLRVGEALRTGTNTLEIEVTNLAANRVRDLDRRGFRGRPSTTPTWSTSTASTPLDASSWPLRESGLLGPVTLRRLRSVVPRPLTERNS